jgi:class 3 adenylate cyclase
MRPIKLQESDPYALIAQLQVFGRVTSWQVERRLAAVLAADVAGYSRLMGVDELGTLAALKAIRHDVVDPPLPTTGAGSSRRPVTGC